MLIQSDILPSYRVGRRCHKLITVQYLGLHMKWKLCGLYTDNLYSTCHFYLIYDRSVEAQHWYGHARYTIPLFLYLLRWEELCSQENFLCHFFSSSVGTLLYFPLLFVLVLLISPMLFYFYFLCVVGILSLSYLLSVGNKSYKLYRQPIRDQTVFNVLTVKVNLINRFCSLPLPGYAIHH